VPFTPAPVGPDERNTWENAYTRRFRALVPNWRWNGPPIPTQKPPYKGLWVDEDGRIWVHLHTAARKTTAPANIPDFVSPGYEWVEDPTFDVITPSGRYVGTVRTTDNIFPQAARGDHLWAIVQSEWGRITVKRYRIEWDGE
jgi:hypothetical protein